LEIAYGSATELEAQLIISLDLGYIQDATFNDLESMISEIQKMISAFYKNIN
jgi:four helix bundle protein